MNNIYNFLKTRGYLAQSTNDEQVEKLINNGEAIFYIGFDPTADSLHVGHFLTLMALRHLQKSGNKPIIVIGGGTAFVGDPSGRSDMRKMLDPETIKYNVDCFKKQMSKFIDFENSQNKAIILDNSSWLLQLNWISFLREFGHCFSVNKMLAAEAFKTRFENESGLSFIEFNYMLMQAYDFYYLNNKYGVNLEIGGSDQWSNIIAGIELIRRKKNNESYGLTLNLLTKSDGTKMGKTSTGAVWLDPEKTKPYDFFQYWVNIDDSDVKKLFLLLTEMDLETINNLCSVSGKEMQKTKKILAYEITKIIHGELVASKVMEQSNSVFGNGSTENYPEYFLEKKSIESDNSISNILVLTKLSPSKSESRRLILSNAISINQMKISDANTKLTDLQINGESFILHKGKKNHIKVVIK